MRIISIILCGLLLITHEIKAAYGDTTTYNQNTNTFDTIQPPVQPINQNTNPVPDQASQPTQAEMHRTSMPQTASQPARPEVGGDDSDAPDEDQSGDYSQVR